MEEMIGIMTYCITMISKQNVYCKISKVQCKNNVCRTKHHTFETHASDFNGN